MTIGNWLKALAVGTALSSTLMFVAPASAMSLQEATRIAIESNPEIGQAAENREAIEFELRQALGLYLPTVDLDAQVGVQRLDNPSRRAAGIQDDPLYRSEIGVTASYDLYDGGYRQSEADRQAARVDGASFRVLERSEYIALQISRVYFQVLLQQRIVGLSSQNVEFHKTMLSNVGSAIGNGRLTEADRQQVQERLAASRARLAEAQQELEAAKIEFNKYVGLPLTKPSLPPRIGKQMPKSLSVAIGAARINNPRVKLAGADIDAASALVEQAASGLQPKVSLEARASTGWDVNGVNDRTTDLSARMVMKWRIYDGGIKSAEVQENVRRESEALLALHQVHREVEEAVRISWDRRVRQGQLVSIYKEQLNASNGLVDSYRQQFGVGNRSLLDVLDSQNTRYNVQVLYETAAYSMRFAEYRLMAASGLLLKYLALNAPAQADAYAREALGTPSFEEKEPRARSPLNLTAPIDLTKFVH